MLITSASPSPSRPRCTTRLSVDTDTDEIEAMFDEYGFNVETFDGIDEEMAEEAEEEE